MAMDFFQREDHARRQTRRLVVMFFLAVATIILAIYLVVAMAVNYYDAAHTAIRFDQPPQAVHAEPTLWQPQLFLAVSLGTIVVITLGSLYKISELSSGGETIALMLGGRAINPQTTDLAERRLLNVVEEMALASGIPVPPVYVLDNEPGINAFAAGHRPAAAVVAVSAGCLQYLTREELQGVMGHEFSHILNGDMRLNLRLIGIVYGILVLAIVGYYIMRSAGSSRDSKNGGGALVIVGVVLVVFGYLGVFLGKLIKSAISRQREFLADASSVQFTRYPAGIAGALKKIGGLADGSRISDGHAEEISHMFFGDAFAGTFFNLFATHPPLATRIRALEPDFDGRFPAARPAGLAPESNYTRRGRGCRAGVRPGRCRRDGRAPGGHGPDDPRPGAANRPAADGTPATCGPNCGQIAAGPAGFGPRTILGRAVIYALLLNRDDQATQARQLQSLRAVIEPPLYQQTKQLAAMVQSLSAGARLPLVDLAVPALKKSSPQQYAQFRQAVEALVAAEHKIDLFEYCIRTVLFGYLDVYFRLKKPPAVRYLATSAIAQPASLVLSLLAYAGQAQPGDAQRAFRAGAEHLRGDLAILPREQCSLKALDAALPTLAQGSPAVKRAVISAVAACIAADGKVTIEESELLRIVAASLGCPVPPVAV